MLAIITCKFHFHATIMHATTRNDLIQLTNPLLTHSFTLNPRLATFYLHCIPTQLSPPHQRTAQMVLKLQLPSLKPMTQNLIGANLNQNKLLSCTPIAIIKSCLPVRFVKNPNKTAKSRISKRSVKKSVSLDREAKKIVHSSQRPSAAAQKVENAKVDFAKNYPVKCKLTLSVLGTSSLWHIIADQKFFENIFLHLIFSDCLSTTNSENLNKNIKSFNRFYRMILHTEPDLIYKSLQHDPDYASQTTILIEYRFKFLLLAVIRQ